MFFNPQSPQMGLWKYPPNEAVVQMSNNKVVGRGSSSYFTRRVPCVMHFISGADGSTLRTTTNVRSSISSILQKRRWDMQNDKNFLQGYTECKHGHWDLNTGVWISVPILTTRCSTLLHKEHQQSASPHHQPSCRAIRWIKEMWSTRTLTCR